MFASSNRIRVFLADPCHPALTKRNRILPSFSFHVLFPVILCCHYDHQCNLYHVLLT